MFNLVESNELVEIGELPDASQVEVVPQPLSLEILHDVGPSRDAINESHNSYFSGNEALRPMEKGFVKLSGAVDLLSGTVLLYELEAVLRFDIESTSGLSYSFPFQATSVLALVSSQSAVATSTFEIQVPAPGVNASKEYEIINSQEELSSDDIRENEKEGVNASMEEIVLATHTATRQISNRGSPLAVRGDEEEMSEIQLLRYADRLGIHFNSKYRVIICLECQSGVDRNHVFKHMKTHHGLPEAERYAYRETVISQTFYPSLGKKPFAGRPEVDDRVSINIRGLTAEMIEQEHEYLEAFVELRGVNKPLGEMPTEEISSWLKRTGYIVLFRDVKLSEIHGLMEENQTLRLRRIIKVLKEGIGKQVAVMAIRKDGAFRPASLVGPDLAAWLYCVCEQYCLLHHDYIAPANLAPVAEIINLLGWAETLGQGESRVPDIAWSMRGEVEEITYRHIKINVDEFKDIIKLQISKGKGMLKDVFNIDSSKWTTEKIVQIFDHMAKRQRDYYFLTETHNMTLFPQKGKLDMVFKHEPL
ncbi:hypothetical protein DFP73DRAFT_529238 [Morchella snyderi]|nr:hypothetical protein DFP73DRAFT_529238 [Morchella snyderi]